MGDWGNKEDKGDKGEQGAGRHINSKFKIQNSKFKIKNFLTFDF